VWQIPETGRRSKGKPIISLLEDIKEGEKIAKILCVKGFDEEAYIFMATRAGVVKKTELNAFSNPRRKGIHALAIDEGDEMIAARLSRPGEQVMLFTRNGMAVRFDESQVRPMGRTARGVKGVTLKNENDKVVGCEVVSGDESILVVCENGFGKRSPVADFRQTKRGGVGVKSIITSERNGLVVGALSVTDHDGIVMMSAGGQTVRISMKDLRVMGRNTQGVKLVNRWNDDVLVAIQRVDGGDEEEIEEEIAHQAEHKPAHPATEKAHEPLDEIDQEFEELAEEEEELEDDDE
jgi:DNA gyrase subunit A